MTREEMFEAVYEYIYEKLERNAKVAAMGGGQRPEIPELTPDTVIRDLDLDSLDLAEMVIDVEDALKVEIDDAEMANVITIEDMVALAEGKDPNVLSLSVKEQIEKYKNDKR